MSRKIPIAATSTVISVAEAVERNSKTRSPGRFTPEPLLALSATGVFPPSPFVRVVPVEFWITGSVVFAGPAPRSR